MLGCFSEHVGEQGCLHPQAGSPGSFCALCRSWCAVEPRYYTNTHLFREDHKTMVQILRKLNPEHPCPWSSYLFCSCLFSWMTFQPCAFFSVQTSARWPCGFFSQASPSQPSVYFGCHSPFKWGTFMTINIIINMRGNISHNQEPSV